ncbi:MAG: SDR family NAD(P)-dependent oxidoreductase [Pseudomonadota bacterium]
MSVQQEPIDLASLRGSIAVVTGAGNNGIGWGICKHAAGELGMHVVAIDLHANLVESAARRLTEMYPDVTSIGIAADVTSPESLAAASSAILARFPGLRIGAVFANAGVIFHHTILKSTLEEWRQTLEVNVIGVVNTLQAFVPLLQAEQADSILCTTASIGGLVRGDGGGAAYQASKHAVVALTESLSFELARKSPQIRVHVLCPCIVQSALGHTSQVNASVLRGELDAAEVTGVEQGDNGLAMTTEAHARQVFDQIAVGNFYMITDNVRPYVDHDFPFDGTAIVKERVDNLLRRRLDNADAWLPGPNGPPSAILKGPLFREIGRRRQLLRDESGSS